MVGKNMLKTQLQTGMIGKPSIAACAKDRGAMSFALSQRDHEVNDANKGESRKQNLVVKKRCKYRGIMRCDRETQTEDVVPPLPTSCIFLDPEHLSVSTINCLINYKIGSDIHILNIGRKGDKPNSS